MTNQIEKKMLSILNNMEGNPIPQLEIMLHEYKSFQQENAKNSNLTVQKIFGRMLRGFRGLGIDNSSIITQVFKTPRFLAEQYAKCQDDKQGENLLNAAKIVFLRQKYEEKQ